jgi:lantibiotic biosynthesis protein
MYIHTLDAQGALRQRAEAMLEQLLAGLQDPARLAAIERAGPAIGASLFGGLPGCALLFDRAAHQLQSSAYHDLADSCLERSLRCFSTTEPSIAGGLAGGAPGLAWCIEHLSFADRSPTASTFVEAVDRRLLEHLDSGQDLPYELLTGLVGWGIYGLERLPHSMAEELLLAILERLEATYVEYTDGIAWPTSPAFMTAEQRRQAPSGYVDCGLAHGVAGIVVLLAGMVDNGIEAERAASLLRDTVAWLMGQELAGRQTGLFPAHVDPNLPASTTRVAWCYGDLGVANALAIAAHSLGDASLSASASRIAVAAAICTAEQAQVEDCTICHGGAGMLHGLLRLERLYPAAELRLGVEHWSTWLLDRWQPGTIAQGAFAPLGLLEGDVGIGLALLTALFDNEPTWDRALGLSVRATDST